MSASLRSNEARYFGPLAAGQPDAPSEYTDLVHELLKAPEVTRTLSSISRKFTLLQSKALRLHLLEFAAHVTETPDAVSVTTVLSAIEQQLDAEIEQTLLELGHWARESGARDANRMATIMAAQDLERETLGLIERTRKSIDDAPAARIRQETRLSQAGIRPHDLVGPLEPTEATVDAWRSCLERYQATAQTLHDFFADCPAYDMTKLNGIELKTAAHHHARITAPPPAGPASPHEFKCAFDPGLNVNEMQLVPAFGPVR